MAVRTDEYGNTWITMTIADGNPQVTVELSQAELADRIAAALDENPTAGKGFADELLNRLGLPADA